MARPKKEASTSRGERLTIRLSPDELTELHAVASARNLVLSDYARRRILGGKLPAMTPRRADPALVLAVNRAGVNLNQIARALNSGLGHSPHELTEALARLNQLLDRLQDTE